MSLRAVLGGLTLGLVLPSLAAAQAWIPQRGESLLSFSYQNLDVNEHLFSGDVVEGGQNFGDEVDLGDIRSQTTVIYLDHAPTRRMALSGSLAYVSAKYVGDLPEAPMDDGSYNGDLQDFGLSLRYMALRGPVVITPFAGVVVPVRNYDTLGHASVGRNLNELQIGTNVGWFHRPSSVYIQGRYGFAFVESVAGQNLDRTNVDLETGIFFTRRFSGRLFGSYRNTHGGIDWLHDIHDEQDFHTHDQAAALEDLRSGAGVSFIVNPNFQVYASYSTTIDGENSHNGDLYTLGTSWSFGRGRKRIGKAETSEETTQKARMEGATDTEFHPGEAALAHQMRY